MDTIDATFPPLDNQMAWGFVLVAVVLLILLQPKGKRLKSVPLWIMALVLAYLILELHWPIVQFLAIAMALFVVLMAGGIWWLTRRLKQIAEQLYNAQAAYQQNHDKAAYLAALQQCSQKLAAIKWFSNRATVQQKTGQADDFREIKLADYLEQQQQLLQDNIIDINKEE